MRWHGVTIFLHGYPSMRACNPALVIRKYIRAQIVDFHEDRPGAAEASYAPCVAVYSLQFTVYC